MRRDKVCICSTKSVTEIVSSPQYFQTYPKMFALNTKFGTVQYALFKTLDFKLCYSKRRPEIKPLFVLKASLELILVTLEKTYTSSRITKIVKLVLLTTAFLVGKNQLTLFGYVIVYEALVIKALDSQRCKPNFLYHKIQHPKP